MSVENDCVHYGYIKKELENHEDRIGDLEEKTTEMDKGYAVLFERAMTTLDPLSAAIDTLSKSNQEIIITMTQMQNQIQILSDNTRKISEKSSDFESSVKADMNKIQEKLGEVDGKSKIDIVTVQRDETKKKLAPYLIGGGVVGGVALIIVEIMRAVGVM